MTPLAPDGSAGIPMSQSTMSMASRPGGSNRDSMAYQNIPSDQYWNEPSRFSTGPYAPDFNNDNDNEYGGPPVKSNKKKWIIGGVILGILAIAGIVAGVVVSQTKNKGSSGGGSSGSGSGNSGDGTDLSNPSQFDKDSRLHQSFWAIAYTPEVSPSFGSIFDSTDVAGLSPTFMWRQSCQCHSRYPGQLDCRLIPL